MSRYQQVCRALGAEPRRWLVTGVAGFIGSALLARLLELGQTVVGLDNLLTGHRRNLEQVLAAAPAEARAHFTFIEGDIREPACCRQACDGADYVLHQAALGSVPWSLEQPELAHGCNVDGFVNVALAARDAGARRLVYASSSAVYGDAPGVPAVEECIGQPLSPYAATKRIGELYASVLQRCYGLETVGLRYFNVFGPRQDPAGPYAAVIPRWIERLLAGRSCIIYGDGTASRDFCFVADAVQANLLAATAEPAATGRAYNVGGARRTTVGELFALMRDRVAELHPEAGGAAPEREPPRPGDIAHSQADIDAARRWLGYAPSHSFGEALAETIAWFDEQRQGEPT